ncbi:MAG: methyltransferase domain-containing protein [Candidatus Dormibacteraeota bacterium]|nr:methyltransferase domain-containing protein [Candidatus Dormibacteraeota bacterium]
MLDVGCGEGYFTGAFARSLPAAEVWGIDISRVGVDMAARRHSDANFAVAAARDLPVLNASTDALTSLFGPQEPTEFRRVLRRGGRALVVGPGSAHLIELRRRIYRDLRAPGRRTPLSWGEGFHLVGRAEIRGVIQLDAEGRRDVLAMTPYAWSAGREPQRVVAGLVSLTTHFLIHEWLRTV